MSYKTMNITVQQANEEELDELLRVDRESWSEELAGSDEMIRSTLKIFPEGYICAYVDGVMAGTMTTMILNFDLDHTISTWEEVTSGGLITNHNPKGNVLYGVSLGVSYKHRGLNVGSKIIERVKQLAMDLDLEFLALGARIPFYHKHPDLDVQDYVNKRAENGERFDPELRFYERCGLKVHRILPDYMSGDWADPESKNYGVLMYWLNPHYSKSGFLVPYTKRG